MRIATIAALALTLSSSPALAMVSADDPANAAPASAAPASRDAPPPSATDAPVSTIDPARRALAVRVVDILLPADEAGPLIEEMMNGMLNTQLRPMMESEETKQMLRQNPAMRAPFNRFIDEMRSLMLTVMREEMPTLREAMIDIYATRFSLLELEDLRRFFVTPTGRSYARQSMLMVNDQPMQRWTTRLQSTLGERIRPTMERFTRDMIAAAPKTEND